MPERAPSPPVSAVEADFHVPIAGEERFRQFAEAMPQMAFISDAAGNILFYNRRFYDYVGTDVSIGGWQWKEYGYLHPEDEALVLERWEYSLRTGETFEVEHRMRRHDGAFRWQLGRAVPVRDAQGNILQWLGTNTDIHEAKLAAELMESTALSLQQAVQIRDDFLSVASHELKTPITTLQLQSQLYQRQLRKGGADAFRPEKFVKLLELTERQTDKLNRLIDDMLDVSRINSGKLAVRREPLSLSLLVREQMERLDPLLVQAKTPATLDCEDGIEGSYDAFRIEQVITNLLTNAMRYGERRPVYVRLQRAGAKAQLSVRDQGRGIGKDSLERIFGRFERSASSAGVSGLGLGLFITRHLVEAHQGRIWAESAGPGQGTTFHVELPLAAEVIVR